METQVAQSTSVSIEELDNLIKSNVTEGNVEGNVTLNADKKLGLGELLKDNSVNIEDISSTLVVNPEFLNEKETTSSVEILKEHFK